MLRGGDAPGGEHRYGMAERDAHLRSPDFFDAARYSTITFKSRDLSGDVEAGKEVQGHRDLSIHGATMEVTSTAPSRGGAEDPWGERELRLSARTEIDRRDWGLKWN